jgi:xenotropic and polytropic retrovirus receptor 1
VGRFRACRDVPLPYDVPKPEGSATLDSGLLDEDQQEPLQPHLTRKTTTQSLPGVTTASRTSAVDIESGGKSPVTIRRRRGTGFEADQARPLSRVGALLHTAHAQDFERRKRLEIGQSGESDDDGSSEEDGDGAGVEETQRRSGTAASRGEEVVAEEEV